MLSDQGQPRAARLEVARAVRRTVGLVLASLMTLFMQLTNWPWFLAPAAQASTFACSLAGAQHAGAPVSQTPIFSVSRAPNIQHQRRRQVEVAAGLQVNRDEGLHQQAGLRSRASEIDQAERHRRRCLQTNEALSSACQLQRIGEIFDVDRRRRLDRCSVGGRDADRQDRDRRDQSRPARARHRPARCCR